MPIRSHGLLLREWRLETEDVATVALASAEHLQAGPASSLPRQASDTRAAAEQWICEGYELEFQDAGARLAVCSWDGDLVLGGLELEVVEASEFMVSFWLLAAEQGCGLESRMLAASIDWLAGSRPHGRLWVAVGRRDHAALAAVRSCGFNEPVLDPPPRRILEAPGLLFQRALTRPQARPDALDAADRRTGDLS